VEEAIILEDDCVPDPCFFRFCEEMLKRYRNDETVASIVGSDFTFGVSALTSESSYYFSRYPLMWGWATWRRAWKLYDPAMTLWPKFRDTNWLEELLSDSLAAQYWRFLFAANYKTAENWDFAWVFSCWIRGAKSIHPSANLISNVGYRPDAFHTGVLPAKVTQLPLSCMEFPFRSDSDQPESLRESMIEKNAFSGTLGTVFQILRNKKTVDP